MSITSKRPGENSKIDSPMAKYTTKGEVMCTLCGKIIKPASQKLWNAHVVSVKHKEMVALLRQSVNSKTSQPSTDVQQTVEDENLVDAQPTYTLPAAPARGILKNKRRPSEQPIVFTPISNENSKDGTDTTVRPNECSAIVSPVPAKQAKLVPAQLNGNVVMSNQITIVKDIKSVVSDVSLMEEGDGDNTERVGGDVAVANSELPAGFFDDPKLDAKARNVEFVDPMEKELAEFQKAIQQEELASEQMQVEEATLTLHEREIEQIEGQMRYFASAATLFEQKRLQERGAAAGTHADASATNDISDVTDTSAMDTKEVIAHFLKLENEAKAEEKPDQTKTLQDNVIVKLHGAMKDNSESRDNIYALNFVKDEPSGSESEDDGDDVTDLSGFDMSNWRKKSILK